VCLRGASEVKRELFDRQPSPRLTPLVVWVPQSRGREEHVPNATSFVADPRARHYWDGEGLLGQGYRTLLGLSEDAWDAFFVYGPDARWEGDVPPAPHHWMHQLGSEERPRVEGPWFDAREFARRAEALIPGPDRAP
jgi:hypothetical protein